MTNVLTLNPKILTVKMFDLRKASRFLALLAAASVVFLFAFYIYQINKIISSGYLVQTYEQKYQDLQKENERLELTLAGITTLNKLQSQIAGLGFEEIGTIYYIQGADTQVVRK